MKKLFTLLTLALVAMAANAQKITFEVGGSTSEWSNGDFKIVATDTDKKIQVDQNNTYFGTATEQVKYESRMKTAAKSSAKLFLTATIPADGNLLISARTGSNSATDRNIIIEQGGKVILDKILLESEAVKVKMGDEDKLVYPVISVPVKAGEATITFPVGSVNFYAFELTAGGTDPEPTPDDPVGEKEVMSVASDAVQALIAAALENPTEISSPNFFIVPDTKIYPVGTQDDNAAAVLPADGTPISLKSYIWEYNSGNLAFRAVSTPNADAQAGEGWQKKGNGNIDETGAWAGNEALNVAGCEPQFLYGTAPKNGNPTASYKDFYEYNNDGDPVHRVFDGPYWEPGCGWVPEKGCFYEFQPAVAGTLKVALWVNKNLNSNPLYIVNATTMTPIPQDGVKVIGFMQNNTFEKNANDEQCGTNPYILNADYKLVPAATPDATPANRPFFGYFTFAVEANTKYLIFSSKSQPGIFGYEFTFTSGINEIVAAPQQSSYTYNLAGQRVNASTKGIVIKNGKKYINK